MKKNPLRILCEKTCEENCVGILGIMQTISTQPQLPLWQPSTKLQGWLEKELFHPKSQLSWQPLYSEDILPSTQRPLPPFSWEQP